MVINTHKGLYQFKRLPFGVASAPAMFQKVMDSILQGIPGVICYIDDILVTGANEEEHLSNLEQVLMRLQDHGLRLKRCKCRFLQKSVKYLGLVVDAEGLHASQEKIEAVTDAPKPRNIKELRSFLGMMNYYRKFIPSLATVLKPLTELLQHNNRWHWNSDCFAAFVSHSLPSLDRRKVFQHLQQLAFNVGQFSICLRYRIPGDRQTRKC